MQPAGDLVLTREECRAIDHYAIHTLGIPGAVLMENAGRNVTDRIVQLVPPATARRNPPAYRSAIVCGKGNNGGDGFVIARHLLRCGWQVHIYLAAAPDELTGDAALNYQPLPKLAIPCTCIDLANLQQSAAQWETSDVVVDALLGTGFEGHVREPLAGIIEVLNSLQYPFVAAVDVPSGLNADTGQPGGIAVEADCTVTFLGKKPGFAAPGASRHTGDVTVADIGIPLEQVLEALGITPRPA